MVSFSRVHDGKDVSYSYHTIGMGKVSTLNFRTIPYAVNQKDLDFLMFHVFHGTLVELLLAHLAAEVELLTHVLRSELGCLLINLHFTDWIYCHTIICLSLHLPMKEIVVELSSHRRLLDYSKQFHV